MEGKRVGEQKFIVNGDIHGRVAMGNRNILYGDQPGQPERSGRRSSDPLGPTIGIVTALPEEFAAMQAFIEDADGPRTVAKDRAVYFLGTLPSRDSYQPHGVVLTLLRDTGNTAAAEACANLSRSYPSIGTVIMCGIACGVPGIEHPERHVRLGDIVVATWGIADYDHVVETDEGRIPRQPFPPPSSLLVGLAKYLAALEHTGERPWERWISAALGVLPRYARPDDATDVVFAAGEPDRVVPHPPPHASGHRPGLPKVHHGLIGSADRALRSAALRDVLARANRVLAFEMEGKGIGSAGFAGGLEWFVVRGISDYGDAHTNIVWRGYASVVAAAYVRALLAECSPLSARGGHPIGDTARSEAGWTG
jgi:nucleoside phosphorylase